MKSESLMNELLNIVLDNHLLLNDAEVCVDGNNIIQSICPNTFTFQIDKLKYDNDTNSIYIILK